MGNEVVVKWFCSFGEVLIEFFVFSLFVCLEGVLIYIWWVVFLFWEWWCIIMEWISLYIFGWEGGGGVGDEFFLGWREGRFFFRDLGVWIGCCCELVFLENIIWGCMDWLMVKVDGCCCFCCCWLDERGGILVWEEVVFFLVLYDWLLYFGGFWFDYLYVVKCLCFEEIRGFFEEKDIICGKRVGKV